MMAYDDNFNGGGDQNTKDVNAFVTCLAVFNTVMLAPVLFRWSIDWMTVYIVRAYGHSTAIVDIFWLGYMALTALFVFYASKIGFRYAVGLLLTALAARGVVLFAG